MGSVWGVDHEVGDPLNMVLSCHLGATEPVGVVLARLGAQTTLSDGFGYLCSGDGLVHPLPEPDDAPEGIRQPLELGEVEGLGAVRVRKG